MKFRIANRQYALAVLVAIAEKWLDPVEKVLLAENGVSGNYTGSHFATAIWRSFVCLSEVRSLFDHDLIFVFVDNLARICRP